MNVPTHRIKSVLTASLIAAVGAVPAFAVTFNLTTAGSEAEINGALFTTNDLQSTGTGVIQSFLRLQASGTELGINSNSSNANLFGATSFGFTRDITLGEIGTTTIDSLDYYIFLLDINQTGANPQLSLDVFSLYTRSTSITDGTPDTLADLQAGTLHYDMDAGGDNAVLLNYLLNPGSGGGDLWVYVPTSLFLGASPSDFLYLYTGFGFTAGYASNDGFEEWATVSPTATVPDGGASVMLLGLGLVSLGAARRFKLC